MHLLVLLTGAITLIVLIGGKARAREFSKRKPEVIKRFERMQDFKHRKRQDEIRLEREERAAEPVRNAINIAIAEGKRYTRCWVSTEDVSDIRIWSNRQGYKALVVKEGEYGETQLSLSGFNLGKS